ncbi:TBC1 domain family member 20 [Galendromus occidentalis]|uniref:TBC1 domain family member 20 n=1 Tax=Galendromus occidentalis TaxID=34638 RepID=A0AAJ6VZ88_9ACAR|nr:TBC1 domain family member 20 [Galendromus occidentalis]
MILRRSQQSVRSVGQNVKPADCLVTETVQSKRIRIENAIRLGNSEVLKDLAISPMGLLEDSLRRRAWPIMLKLDGAERTQGVASDTLRSHQYYQQVLADVQRSIRRFPPSIPRVKRLRLQDKLNSLIMRILVANPDLHYYQGYHDICVTVLLVLDGDEDLAFRIVEDLSRTKLRPFMEVTVQGTVRQLDGVYPLLGHLNEPLKKFLEKSQCGVMFLLPWCITWFGHDLTHYATLVRLFDLFLASEELMPIYLAASIILKHHAYLLKQECSLSSVHAYLGRVLHLIDCAQGEMEERIQFALESYRRFPLKRSAAEPPIIMPKTKRSDWTDISDECRTSVDTDFVIL